MPLARVALYLASACVLVVAGRALFGSPPPLALALLLAGAYAGLLLAGVLVLRLRLYIDAIVRGPRGARGVVLTFDDGPDPKWTPVVLDDLDAAGAKATFFVIGKKAEAHPALVREIVARGHEVGVHGYEHDRLFSLRSEAFVQRDLERAKEVLGAIVGRTPVLFRPPVGHTNPRIARVVDALDLVTVGWSVRGLDGRPSADPERVAARIRVGLDDGAIVLLHDAAERGDFEPAGPRALPLVLDAIEEKRLPIVPLATWLPSGRDASTAAP
jgi:peptidoglycan/xylan/chitin deacetylase (PgdA/CDA1 family)